MKRQSFWGTVIFFLLGLTAHFSLYDLAIAQQQSAGVVTGLQGQAQLTRPAATPSALKFKDGVVIRDVVDTREKSLARILFGGRSTVTVRELSRLEVREELLPTGARRDVHDLSSGAILVNVARQLMRPGDEVQIRTPNAVAAVRGSTVFGSYNPITQASFFAILSGFGLITPQGLPPITVTANTQNNGANVSGSGPGVQANAVNVPPGQVNQILAESQVGKAVKGEANKEQSVQAAVKEAAALANAVIETVTESQQATTSESTTSSNTAPVVADTSKSTDSGSSSTKADTFSANTTFQGTPSPSRSPTFGTLINFDDLATGVEVPFDRYASKGVKSIKQIATVLGSVPPAKTISGTQSSPNYVSTGSEFNFDGTFRIEFSTATNKVGIGIADGSGVDTLILRDKDLNILTSAVAPTGSNTYFGFERDIVDVFFLDIECDFCAIDDLQFNDPPLYIVPNGQTLVGPIQKPLVEFSNQSSTFDSVLVASGPSSAVSLSGPLLKAERSELTVPYSLLGLLDGGTLTTTTSDPLVWLQGGNYSLSTLKGTAIFDFWGTETALDAETGVQVGTGKTVTHAGPLLEASGGATVDTQKVLKLDTALLEATAPIISLLGTESAQSGLTTQQSTIDLMKAKVTSTGPVIAMDKSFINVTNGALINLTHGSNMKVIGDLISMYSGSKINVVNGPLISVAGAGSLLDVSGALVNFGGTGGNKIVVNNSIAPTATLSGLPVSATFGGSVSIANPIKNPNLGSISVNGTLISATNGGKVDIKGK